VRRLPERSARDDQTVHCLDIPVQTNQLGRQPIEQLRMRRPFTAATEILRGTHQARAEMMLPKPIRCDAGCERVFRTDQPPRKRQAVARSVAGKAAKGAWEGGRELFTLVWLPMLRCVSVGNSLIAATPWSLTAFPISVSCFSCLHSVRCFKPSPVAFVLKSDNSCSSLNGLSIRSVSSLTSEPVR